MKALFISRANCQRGHEWGLLRAGLYDPIPNRGSRGRPPRPVVIGEGTANSFESSIRGSCQAHVSRGNNDRPTIPAVRFYANMTNQLPIASDDSAEISSAVSWKPHVWLWDYIV